MSRPMCFCPKSAGPAPSNLAQSGRFFQLKEFQIENLRHGFETLRQYTKEDFALCVQMRVYREKAII
jgi:hypothetical protein